MYLSRCTAQQIVRMMKDTGYAFAIVDWDARCLADTGEEMPQTHTGGSEPRSSLCFRAEQIIRDFISPGDAKRPEKKKTASVRTVLSDGLFVCYLVIFTKADSALNRYIEALIRWEYKNQPRLTQDESTEARRLLTGHVIHAGAMQDEIRAYARWLGMTLNLRRRAILFAFDDTISIKEIGGTEDIWERLESRLEENETYKEDIYGPLGNGHFLIFRAAEQEACDKTIRDITRYLRIVTRDLVTVTVCTGSAYDVCADLHMSYEEAMFLLENRALYSTGDGGAMRIEDHIFEYLYSRMDADIREALLRELTALFERKPKYRDTCIALASCGTSLAKAAEKLDIHENTMLQRMRRLKEVAGISPTARLGDKAIIRAVALQKKRKTIWNAGIIVQPGSILHKGLLHLAQRLKDRSGGEFVLNAHAISISGDNHQLFDMLDRGVLDMALGSVMALDGATHKKIEALFLPFLFDSTDMARHVMNTAVIAEFAEDLDKAGMVFAAMWSMGWRYITSKAPVHSPEDLRGRRMRVLASDINERFFSQIGMVPIQIYYSDIAAALESGMIDCQENPYSNILEMNFYKYQRYALEMNMYISPESLCCSKRSYDRLDEDMKGVLRAAVSETTDWIYEQADILNDAARAELEKRGLKILRPDEESVREWKKQAGVMYRDKNLQDVIKKIEAAKRSYRRGQEQR